MVKVKYFKDKSFVNKQTYYYKEGDNFVQSQINTYHVIGYKNFNSPKDAKRYFDNIEYLTTIDFCTYNF